MDNGINNEINNGINLIYYGQEQLTKFVNLISNMPGLYRANFRGMKMKELKEICRSEPQKYSGFSKLRRTDLINFMYQRSSIHYISERGRRLNANASIVYDLYDFFETEEEKSERLLQYCIERPEEDDIQSLVSVLKQKYPSSNVIFDKHDDHNNDLIYRGNKGKYISQHGSLGEHGEMILYHGTDGENLIGILGDDFRLTSNPVHGHMYGKGIYFTNDIDKAIYYSERKKNTKYVIVCNVHVGDICLGNGSMDIHPKMPDKDKTFDTSVDNISRPKQFIKKKNGTYNILGILTIENYEESKSSHYSGSFHIINKTHRSISLYWIPPNVTHNTYNIDIRKCKEMGIIPPSENSNQGSTRKLCQIGHQFACVSRKYTGQSWNLKYKHNTIVKLFESTKKNEKIIVLHDVLVVK